MRHMTIPIAAVGLIFLSGCATPSDPGSTALSQSSDIPFPSLSETQLPDPENSATPDQNAPEPAVATNDLVSACLGDVSQIGPGPKEQVERSTVLWDEVRQAFRPDRQWYVFIPIDDPEIESESEYQCLLNESLDVVLLAGRTSPLIDDFEQWATATELRGGL